VVGLDHVQLAMPPGGEDRARAFYGGALGMREVDKPAGLAGRGGVWFESAGARLHLGVEEPFAPARKAHPALLVRDLDEAARRLAAAGAQARPDGAVAGVRRAYTTDPFGNRVELIADPEGLLASDG
jgi:catechol 2,3-dioxygenase-like lactoylglutathione lyase family enzyme